MLAETKSHRADGAGEWEQPLLLVVGAHRRDTIHAHVHGLGAAALRNLFLDPQLSSLLAINHKRDIGRTTGLERPGFEDDLDRVLARTEFLRSDQVVALDAKEVVVEARLAV